ncbi:MAG: hypothetical protein SOY60_06855 [Fusobacterium gastrosuis]|uniref:hypothetical protein n=1 Tax=Fusobacterium gastrosuis TaxID=1755100 RepID=UPI002A8E49FA|nr:hypothetical protein [Fusobacterium gastrosuis]MDY5795481.1 hypothetical protein [Fusobacterium gastrosuis]
MLLKDLFEFREAEIILINGNTIQGHIYKIDDDCIEIGTDDKKRYILKTAIIEIKKIN